MTHKSNELLEKMKSLCSIHFMIHRLLKSDKRMNWGVTALREDSGEMCVFIAQYGARTFVPTFMIDIDHTNWSSRRPL